MAGSFPFGPNPRLCLGIRPDAKVGQDRVLIVLHFGLALALQLWDQALEPARTADQNLVQQLKIDELKNHIHTLLDKVSNYSGNGNIWPDVLIGSFRTWTHKVWRLELLMDTYFWNREDDLGRLTDSMRLVGVIMRTALRECGGRVTPVKLLAKPPEGVKRTYDGNLDIDGAPEYTREIKKLVKAGFSDFAVDMCHFPWFHSDNDRNSGQAVMVVREVSDSWSPWSRSFSVRGLRGRQWFVFLETAAVSHGHD